LKSRKPKPIDYPSLRRSLIGKVNAPFALHASATPLRKLYFIFFAHRFDNENSLSCGHTFCALCIREQFCGRLMNNISQFCQENEIFEPICLPKTLAQRQKLTRLITSYRGDSRKVFSYQCPQCRGLVEKAPVIAYQFRLLLRAVRAALPADTGDNGLPTDEFPVTATFFESLFE